MIALDLACGQHPQPGFIGVDLWPGADIQANLQAYPWPWETSSVDGVHCSHYVEHEPDLIGFMNELWRILKPGATAYIIHPYAHSNRAWQDPTHVRALNEDSWRYYNEEERRNMGVDHYPILANFEIVKINFILAANCQMATMQDIHHKINVVDDLHVELQALK